MTTQRGLLCPCGQELNTRMVATSKQVPGGHLRSRYCGACHKEVQSFERVIDASPAPDAIIVSGIAGHDKGVLRRIIEAMGGTIWR